MALKFSRNTKKIRIKKSIILFGSIFLVSLIFFEILLNFRKNSGKVVGNESTLPVLYEVESVGKINPMHGFLQPFKVGVVNSPMMPTANGHLKFSLDTYGGDVSDITYTLYDEAGKNTVTSGTTSFSTEKKSVDFEINLPDHMKKNQIFLLKITAKVDDKEVNFYSRTLNVSNDKISESITFASEIRSAILAKDETKLTKMEPDESKYTDSLADVNIHSSMKQITWGQITLTKVSDPMIVVNSYVNDCAEITYTYYASDGKNQYNVNEYFKIRNSDKCYLSDYSRRTEQVFSGTRAVQRQNGLELGVVPSDVKYISNQTGRIAAFVNCGRLFEYNQTTGKITKVFDFGDGKSDVRTDFKQHGIRLLSIDEGGSIDFAVYGYMNSGMHEGYCGISFYKYDSTTNQTSEQVFTKSEMPYEFLKTEYGDTVYRSRTGSYTIMSDGVLYQINPSGDKITKLLSGLDESQYAESKQGRYISWTEKAGSDDTIYTIDLDSGKKYKYKAKAGEEYIPLLYVGEDLIFGKLNAGSEGVDEDGNKVYPMTDILIGNVSSGSFKVVKEYPQTEHVVTAVSESDDTLYLTRSNLEDGVYKKVAEDVIKNTFSDEARGVDLTNTVSEKSGVVYSLAMKNMQSIPTKQISVASVRMKAGENAVSLPTPNLSNKYYVLKGGNIVSEDNRLNRQIESAADIKGSVIDSDRLVWSSARRERVSTINVNESVFKDIRDEKNGYKYLKLKGADLKNVLYFVSNGTPVYAQGADTEYLIIGYDSIGITVYNASKGVYETTMQSAFGYKIEQNGNNYKAFLK